MKISAPCVSLNVWRAGSGLWVEASDILDFFVSFCVKAKRKLEIVSFFLPASGARHIDDMLYAQGERGIYWASTQSSSSRGHRLWFDSSSSEAIESVEKNYGRTIRCVRWKPIERDKR